MNPNRHPMILAAVFALVTACSVPPPTPAGPHDPESPAPPSRTLTVAGRSREGRPIEVEVLGSGPQAVLVIAAIHGDEGAGTPLVDRLADHLLEHSGLLAGRTVVLVPVANPDGVARGTRGNSAGVDLNRNFPTGNYRPARRHGPTPLSEPESRAIHDLIVKYAPVRVVSIHQPLGVVDHDGPGRELAASMAKACGLPARKLGARPGSLGSWVGVTLGRAIVTLEMPGGRGDPQRDWDRYGAALRIAVTGETESNVTRGAVAGGSGNSGQAGRPAGR